MTISELVDDDDNDALTITKDTLEDLIWQSQMAMIDLTEPQVMTPSTDNPEVPIAEYARLLAIDPSDNPPTPRTGWEDFPPDPDEPTGLFRTEVVSKSVVVWSSRQIKLETD